MLEGPPQQHGYLGPLVLRLWHAFLVVLWRRHRGRTWQLTLQESPFREHSDPLLPGCYLFFAHSHGVDAVAITDRLHPERSAAWLLTPGLNFLWMQLQQPLPEPVFEWLGGQAGGKPALKLAGKRTWRALETLASLLRVSIFDGLTDVLVARYRVLWPVPRMSGADRWYRWALSVHELTYLNLERHALHEGAASAGRPASSVPPSILSAQTSRPARLGAVAHLHYLELWPEFRNALRRLPPEARVFLTISDCALQSGDITAQTVMAEMAAERPDAVIQLSPNVGRDVGPFMRLLAEGRFDGLDCVCKIHGKRSLRRERTLIGETWRQYAIDMLLPSPESIDNIGRYFITNPRLGILGPARLRLPSNRVSESIDNDRGLLRELMLSRFDRDVTERIVFFAGTMFWFRPEALNLLRQPPPGGWRFHPEPAPNAGSLANALERLLPTSALLAGYRVESLPEAQ